MENVFDLYMDQNNLIHYFDHTFVVTDRLRTSLGKVFRRTLEANADTYIIAYIPGRSEKMLTGLVIIARPPLFIKLCMFQSHPHRHQTNISSHLWMNSQPYKLLVWIPVPPMYLRIPTGCVSALQELSGYFRTLMTSILCIT